MDSRNLFLRNLYFYLKMNLDIILIFVGIDLEMILDKQQFKDLEKELKQLREYLNYKNSRFCKSKLENIIQKYFKK